MNARPLDSPAVRYGVDTENRKAGNALCTKIRLVFQSNLVMVHYRAAIQ